MSYIHNEMTVGEIPEYFGNKFDTKNKVAVKSNQGFEVTWEQLNKRSNQLARIVLEDFKLEKGDKVVAFLTNCGEYPEIIYGLAKIGVLVTPTNYRFVARELKYAIEHSDAKAIILSESLYDIFKEIKEDVQIQKENILIVGDGELANYEDRLREKTTSNIVSDVEENDYFILAFTGGTTGYPKAALISHKTIIEYWQRIALEFTILENDKVLLAGPFYHTLGFLFGLQQLGVGGTLYILDKFDAEHILKIIQNEKITATPMVPTMYNEILNVANKNDYDVSSMRVLVSAGSPLLTKVKEGIIEFFSNSGLFEFYGSTEHGLFSVIKPKDQMRKNRSCGLPFYGVEIKILNDDGNEVKQGEIGEVYKKGLLLGAEYYKNEQATADNFRGDWASSGDMGYVDNEGFLYIVDRKSDKIISGGANIFPSEVEEVILSHPGVREVAVVGLLDEKWGEVVSAFIVKKDGMTLKEEDILTHCDQLIASYKKPKKIVFIDELPKSAAGKVLRRKLRDIEVSL